MGGARSAPLIGLAAASQGNKQEESQEDQGATAPRLPDQKLFHVPLGFVIAIELGLSDSILKNLASGGLLRLGL